MFSKRLNIDDWKTEQMDDCIQMTQVHTSQGLVQLINVYVMTDRGQVTLRNDSALRKVPDLFDKGLECVLLIGLQNPPGNPRTTRPNPAIGLGWDT